ILANIWYEDVIVRISPQDGRVLGWLDLRSLWPARERPDREHVLNGIAYDAANDRLFVTGKQWPRLYEIRIADQ
ncbi:MAG: glutaminyl-peptide cyclotransferase, partial [Planctomycetaceae bacterium]|nr:glutaminyl-peptide cyclotransferase [Planctomycetaceae bacterium]